ncbi:lysine 2,3-aminomutase [Pelotomaculum terephthalicicum JT]|uniref:lysine 2,3-aminomutase n=1 Tax=Pelotomaculum TaxID=191373 RepID=UPI0009CBBFA1|nr:MULTISPECIES: lysine 2,3-aminomutase [Pelotomaculum]MCG9968352.1 lysine 2,3-aminomutase [Pelotomaculum terephthalicicum JT]OPX87654.1 MAG: L-lysine 2,3-aminomutase [Pelotomaculum sp. PtaB.Bin117]OPY61248.1 MAG: L-lysine 2,3-aminomutase [Pelotomaculum sp. PtaU1.Bin065]
MKTNILPIRTQNNADWSDWRWQMQQRIHSVKELVKCFDLNHDEELNIQEACEVFPMSITPYYASLINKEDPRCPIRLQCMPNLQELVNGCGDMDDPLYEDADSPVPGLTHRYPDRVLLLITNECAMYCRHCTRKRKVGDQNRRVSEVDIDRGIEYIKSRPEIRDVLLSGGDPFVLSCAHLEKIIAKVRAIPHVQVIRIGTRTPVVLPQRITNELVKMLKKYHPIWINTHFNHPREFTPESTQALAKLADAGIPLGNQTVLLKGINDCSEVMKKLSHLLVQNRVRPYYLYQCDLSRGIEHFRTPIAKGIEIMEALIGHTSGFAVPTYVVDAPGGGGKIPVLPNYQLSMTGTKTILRNYEGVICVYEEPAYSGSTCSKACSLCKDGNVKHKPVGLQKLVDPNNRTISLIPEGNIRRARFFGLKGDPHGR